MYRRLFLLVFVLLIIFVQSARGNGVSGNDTSNPNIANMAAFLRDATNVTALRRGRTVFLVKDKKTMHTFPDRYTMQTYGLGFGALPFAEKSLLESMSTGPGVPSLWDHHTNHDVLALGSSSFLVNTTKVFSNLLNPSLVYLYKQRQYHIGLCWRIEPGSFRVLFFSRQQLLELDKGKNGGSDSSNERNIEADLDILSRIVLSNDAKVPPPFPYIDLKGEDPRLFVKGGGVGGKGSGSSRAATETAAAAGAGAGAGGGGGEQEETLWVVYCTRYAKQRPEIRMNYAQIFVTLPSSSPSSPPLIKLDDTVFIDFQNEQPKEDQKNWSPFEYKDEFRFIGTSTPHRIVQVKTQEKKTWLGQGHTVALTSFTTPKWKYGELRGGTPALLVNNGSNYLTFFHSSLQPIEPQASSVSFTNMLKTYFMGAYLFSSSPPFAIQATSVEPIIHHTMYTGPWSDLPLSYYHMDYIVFPMSFFLDQEKDAVYLLYGRQDIEGWVAKLSLSGLLASLKPVHGKSSKEV